MHIALVKMPYTGARNLPEISGAPDHVDTPELRDALREAGAAEVSVETVGLRDDQEREHGGWHRMGLACGNLAAIVAEQVRRERFPVGLLGNCTGLLGMLSGIQRAAMPGRAGAPRRTALLFVDAHADFNTPETSLSGMLGGMPVAVAAGLCLTRLRLESGLDPAVPPERIAMVGVRDVDPAERELLRREAIEVVGPDDLHAGSARLSEVMRRLSSVADAIYVHVDMDVLDPREVGGHPFAIAGGPSSAALGSALAEIAAFDAVAALGIASTPAGARDPQGLARCAAQHLIAAAVGAVMDRGRAT